MDEVAVVGSGIMGNGIAQTMAAAGLRVQLFDLTEELLGKALKDIEGSLNRMVKKGDLTAQAAQETLGRIKPSLSTDFSPVATADIVLEVVPEKFEIKSTVLQAICAKAKPNAVIASNTSSISITKMGGVIPAERSPNFAGMHFFNPVPVMKLVEVIKGLKTSDETIAKLTELGKKIGKTPVPCIDSPGFMVNRILVPQINEAIFAVHEGVAKPADIDQGMKLGANHPMGPLQLADLIGLDTILSVLEVMHHELGEDKYRPCPLLRKMVDAKQLGRKTGQGFFSYSKM